jgi:hypothetical protein
VLTRFRRDPLIGNVLGLIAVFIALGGGAVAAFHLGPDSVKSKNIVDGQVQQADIAHTVTVSGAGFATNAGHATSADSATNAESADSATEAGHAASADNATTAASADSATNAGHAGSADLATHAADADNLGGQGPSAYALAGAEAVQPAVLATGNPSSFCHWTNYGNGQNDVGYYRDRAGVVHLQGLVIAHDGSTACGMGALDFVITTLPAGYRPTNATLFPTLSNNTLGRVNVRQDGQVRIEPNFPAWADAKVWVSLDGLSFRCAPSGQNGCP